MGKKKCAESKPVAKKITQLKTKLIKTRKQLTDITNRCTVEEERHLTTVIDWKSKVIDLEMQLSQSIEEKKKLKKFLKISEKNLAPEKNLTRCTLCKTNTIVED